MLQTFGEFFQWSLYHVSVTDKLQTELTEDGGDNDSYRHRPSVVLLGLVTMQEGTKHHLSPQNKS